MNESTVHPTSSFPDLSLAHVSVSRGDRFPRWEASGAIYHIGLHLADSVPTAQLDVWREKRELTRIALADRTTSAFARQQLIDELHVVFNENVERYLSAGHGECLLQTPDVARSVSEILKHDNGRNYALHEYTIMPNHLHVIVGGFPDSVKMKDVVSQWKSISAHAVNRICGRKGDVWQRDAYTHIIRSREEYARQLKYVWANPETAGLTTGFLRERFV